MSFLGYVRPDGSVGIRNYVLVLPGGLIADKVCNFVRGTRSIVMADSGSGRTKLDREAIARVNIGLGLNPNCAAAVVHNAGLGSEYAELRGDHMAEEIAKSGKPVEYIDIGREGGTLQAIEKAIKAARVMARDASRLRRQVCEDGQLTLGVKCGASDPTSGIAGNPAIGYAYDKVIAAGGTAFFGETTEIIGAEHILAKRAVNENVAKAILEASDAIERKAKESGQDIRSINPIPANISAGISTLEEKSLGAIHKAGSSPIQGVLQYGERPKGKGLYFVDNWMTFNSIFAGYAASGATVVLFQLGGGGMPNWHMLESAPTGGTPLVWCTANPQTWAWAGESIDFFSGGVIEGTETLEEAGERLYKIILDTASGTMTKAETINYEAPAQIYTLEPAF